MIRWIMCCSQCKADYAYTEEPSQQPKSGTVPIAEYWKYMDGKQVKVGDPFHCKTCDITFQPMMRDVVIEETTTCKWID